MTIIETNNKGARLKSIQPESSQAKKHELTISETYDQTIQGFGGAFTEASAYNLSRVNKEKRWSMIKAYFDPEEGIGYQLGRISINSCDFGLNSYDYVDAYDESLASFHIGRDQHIIDLILDAEKIAGKKLSIVASPWSPPFWMKDNQSMIYGGKLLPKYYDLWAQYIIKFIHAYKNAGIDIQAITVQNEPQATQRWESCIYDHEEEKQMVITLGKAFENAGLNTHIYIWDHNRDVMFERASHILSDPQAAKYTYGVAFHWYDDHAFDEVKKTHTQFPDKHLLFTEGCQEGGPHIGSYEVAERYGINMMKDLHHGTEGYIDWNLFLDMTGGPNHVSNLCSSPILVDVFPEQMIKNPSYYYIAHISKYVLPGARRLVSSMDSDVLHNVFENPDGSYVILLLNSTEEDRVICTEFQNKKLETHLNAHSFQTIIL